MSRTFAVHDRVATRELVDEPWQLGTVTKVTAAGYVAVRPTGSAVDRLWHPDDARLVPVDEVPVADRHWVPESVRDQLVRQEAAGRLRAMAEHLPPEPGRVGGGLHLARHFDDLIGRPDLRYADAARVLLAPAPQPATAP